MTNSTRSSKTTNDNSPEVYRSEAFKEQYKKHYAESKAQGEPFFPDVIFQDAIVSVLVFAAVFCLAIFAGAPLEDKADPTNLNVIPRPEWYFLFLFQFLKYVPSQIEGIIGVLLPGVAVGFLFLLPFIDRNPRRYVSGRPMAFSGGLATIAAIVVLTVLGGLSGPPSTSGASVSQAASLSPKAAAGKQVFQTNGCASCHAVGGVGGTVGPDLTNVGSKRDAQYIKDYVTNPRAKLPNGMMPAFASLSSNDLDSLVEYLSSLK